MATYPTVSPATLANWSAVINDPTNSEDANRLAEVDLQTRKFLYDFLITKFDPSTGLLLPAAIGPTTLTGSVAGSTGNAGTQQNIVQGTVSTPDLRDLAVSTGKLNNLAVTTAKIGDAQVSTGKLVDGAVTASKIAAGTITPAQLATDSVDANILKDDATGAAGAVTTDHIRTGAVTALKLANGSVGTAQLVAGSVAGQILITGDTPFQFAVKSLSGAVLMDKNGVVTLTSSRQCEIVERVSNGTICGASTAGTWHVRGNTAICPAWFESFFNTTPTSFLTITADGRVAMPIGTYVLEASAPAYKTGRTICRLTHYNVSNIVLERFYGTSQISPVAAGLTIRTNARAMFAIGTANDYFTFEHYCELADANGLGFPTTSGGDDEIYATIIIRQIA